MLLSSFQKAIFKRLQAVNLSCDVFDLVPEGTDLPYAILGEDSVIEYNTKSSIGKEITTKIYIYSNASSSLECKEIFDTIRQALSADLTEEDFDFCFHRLEPSGVSKDINLGLIAGELNLTYRLEEE